MDISNRALAMFLLAAIVVSLAGTLTSLNRLGSLTTTGFATSDTGTVQLDVQSQISITLDTFDTINFGTCTPVAGHDAIINSEVGVNTSAVCSGFTANNHTIRNDGNAYANVTINATHVNSSFLPSGGHDSTYSTIAYKGENHGRTGVGGRPGCTGTLTTSYTNLSRNNTRYQMCTNLSHGASANSFTVDFQITVPYDVVQGTATTTIEYRAADDWV